MTSLTTKALQDVPLLGSLADTDHVLVSPGATPNVLSRSPISDFITKLKALLALVFDDLTDVDMSTPPSTNQSLKWNGTAWVPFTPPAPGASALTGLSDVLTSSPTNGQALAFNSSSGKWTNQSLTITGSSLFTTLPQFIGCSAKKAADEVGADYTTAAVVTWDGEDFDTDAFHSNVTNNSRQSVVTGLNIDKVVVSAKIALDLLTVNTTVRLEILKNGTTVVATDTVNLGNVTSGGIEVSSLPVAVTPGTDYFEVRLRVVGSSSVTVLSAQSRFVLQVVGATNTGTALDDLSDVATSGVSDQKALIYDGATSQWKPKLLGAVTDHTVDYTFVLADSYSAHRFNKATAINATVPTNASVAFPVGIEIEIGQIGVGVLTVVAAGGVTINAPQGLKFTQYQYGRLRKTATDTWSLQIYGLNYTTPLPEQSVTSGTSVSIDRSLGEITRLSLTGTVTSFTVTNWPATGTFGRLVLEIANTGAFGITTWPTGTIWPAGTTPIITSGAGKKDIIILMTFDGGTTIYGSIAGQDYH